jgi:hypothetical protein
MKLTLWAVALCLITLAGITATATTPPASATQPAVLKPLEAGVFTSGKWEYRCIVTLPGTRSEGRLGELRYDGKMLPEPANTNDYVLTPWGLIYWYGKGNIPWNGRGWIPTNPSDRKPIGDLVASPTGEAQTIVWVQLIDPTSSTLNNQSKPVTGWVKEALDKVDLKQACVIRDWTPLLPTGASVQFIAPASRRNPFELALHLGQTENLKPVQILNANNTIAIELPRVNNTTQLQKIINHIPVEQKEIEIYIAYRVATTVAPTSQPATQAKP